MIYKVCLTLIAVVQLANADPCRINFGGCDRTNGLCWSTGRDTHFCSCKAGYKEVRRFGRVTCQDVDECANSTSCGQNADCFNTDGSYFCACRCGYINDYTGKYCLDASHISDACMTPSLCSHREALQRDVRFDTRFSRDYLTEYFRYVRVPSKVNRDTRRCECEQGFTLNRCGYCVDINECQRDRGICKGNQARCINTEGSFYCECDNNWILGPCRRECFEPGTQLSLFCETPSPDVLASVGFEFRSFVRPHLLTNYRTCGAGKRTGETTIERFNLDANGGTDVTLTWDCKTSPRESTLKNIAEEEARWDNWTCWTACKATCWGGLQTRVRKCLNGLPGLDGCLGDGSEKRECYTGPKCPFRVRKHAAQLTTAEIADLRQAMERFKEDTSATGFFNLAAAHGWPGQCMVNNNRESCCPHGAKLGFLTWHRSIILNFEEGLSRYLRDKTLGIPYWNFLASREDREPPQFILEQWYDFFRPNPFANMTVRIDRTGPMRTIQRDAIFRPRLDNAERQWLNIASVKMSPHQWHDFAEATEAAHGGAHVSACGQGRFTQKCALSFASLDFSGFDPLFMLHHCNIDRLWAVAQKTMEDDGKTTWTLQSTLEAFEDASIFSKPFMPFANSSLSPFPVVKATNTMRDSYYYEELTGVRYDYLGSRGYPPVSQRGLDVARQAQGAVLFVAQYFSDTSSNFYVNYYDDSSNQPCSQLTSFNRLGGTSRLGQTTALRQRVPQLTLISDQQFRSRLDQDITVRACYTSINCTDRCPEVSDPAILQLPTPNLVFYVPNTPVDIYKFHWATGRRFPSWYVNIAAINQWVYFYGNRRNNIVQVRTSAEYFSCNANSGRRLSCSISGNTGGACIFPSGVYFLVDSNPSFCRNGLRMIIVSRH
ncbi:uncharacterized protein LOC120339325 [Styela clava]